MLTDLKVRRALPKAKGYKLSDHSGLFIYVTPKGAKSWRLKYRFAGKERQLVFGLYPEVGLAEARERRDGARRLLRDGIDPGVERRRLAASAASAADDTFEAVAREWHGLQSPLWAPLHAGDVLRSLEAGVFPVLGRLPVTSIDAPMVLGVLRAIQARGSRETAHRVRQRIAAVFTYAIASGKATANPAALLKGALAPVLKGRQPAVTDLDAARAILRDVEAIPSHPVTKLAHRLLALTALRPGTLATTPWEEFADLDPDTPIWRIPPARMKMRRQFKEDDAREHWVSLSRQALEVIAVLRGLTGRGPLVFPNTRFAHRPMSENALGYMLNRAGYHGRHVPHGWRATFSTVMNERFKADSKVIDLMLAHVPKDQVERAYNRAAHLERRRELAQLWADLITEGLPPPATLLTGRRKPSKG